MTTQGGRFVTARQQRVRRRRGATAVEAAFVLTLTASFVFGVFEYCRLLMDMNLLNNAAREGCRYALVNNTSPTITADVQKIATTFMAGEIVSYNNFSVTVSGTHNGVTAAVNSLSAGDLITVTVSGTYRFMNVVPLTPMPVSLPVTSAVTMGCEGGT